MKTTVEDYFDPGLGMPLLNRYEFSSWDNERDNVPLFTYLNEDICWEMGLAFSLKDLSYYRGEEKVVEVYQASTSTFYYMRQDILEEILEKFNVHLDFEMYADKSDLKKKIGDENRSRVYRKVVTYEDVK